jgi:probable HAF family extracellular repeat protein
MSPINCAGTQNQTPNVSVLKQIRLPFLTLALTLLQAQGINNLGQIVGYAQITGNSAYHAFLYSGGKMQDLNNLLVPNSGWTLASANKINDRGQIVGYGFSPLPDGPHAFLLTPAKQA